MTVYDLLVNVANKPKRERERENVYFPQYNKIYVALNDSNETKWRVAEMSTSYT